MALERIKQNLWHVILDRGIVFASDLLARLPASIALGLAEAPLRRRVPWEEGTDFLLHILRTLHRDWSSMHPNVRRGFIENVFGRLILEGTEKRERTCELLGDRPIIMVISPTMRCNLRCDGCYSYHYRREDAISTDRLDRLYSECEALGIQFIVVSGGEPYLREDTLDLFAAHPDLYFLTYTNGTAIADNDLAPKLAALGNVMPCVSVEGFEAETDQRRGRGVHAKILKAMAAMKQEGMLFGYSATPMRHNNELLVSDTFVDYYLEKGAKVGWYFSYMPLGRSPDLTLMPTPAQRLYRYNRIRTIRKERPLIAADFWCDGMLTGGCLSGGRTYFHVNASGGVEPCVFHQYSVDNINDKSLVECLDSPYFRDIRHGLRDVENPLRPCPIIDNPEMLRDWVSRHKPVASQPGGDAILGGEPAQQLDQYARELKQVFDPVFSRDRQGCPWPLEVVGTMKEKEADWAARRQRRGCSSR